MENRGNGDTTTLWRVPRRRWLLGIPIGGALMFLAGILFWGGFHTVMDATNSLAFCTGCHEMRDTVYEEYKLSKHYKNASGVRAVCSDCHVPKPWLHKVIRKIQATNELYHKMAGTIDTPEKFESQRLAMAERVWAAMRETDSRECRNCHSFDGMDIENQGKYAKKGHDPRRLERSGKTCIDCHQGIAHKKPADY